MPSAAAPPSLTTEPAQGQGGSVTPSVTVAEALAAAAAAGKGLPVDGTFRHMHASVATPLRTGTPQGAAHSGFRQVGLTAAERALLAVVTTLGHIPVHGWSCWAALEGQKATELDGRKRLERVTAVEALYEVPCIQERDERPWHSAQRSLLRMLW